MIKLKQLIIERMSIETATDIFVRYINKNEADHITVDDFSRFSKEELKSKHKDLVKKYHPDKGGNNEAMQWINAAYDVLSNKKDFPYIHISPVEKAKPLDELVLKIIMILEHYGYVRESPEGTERGLITFHTKTLTDLNGEFKVYSKEVDIGNEYSFVIYRYKHVKANKYTKSGYSDYYSEYEFRSWEEFINFAEHPETIPDIPPLG